MVSIENLSFTYSGGTEALKNIDIAIPNEHIFAIMGFSGSGKTTLLYCIARFLKPQKGLIFLNNKNIWDMKEKDFRTQIGVVFQGLNLFPHLSVAENLTLAPCRIHGLAKNKARIEALEMLERLGIPELADHYPSHISGGQAQRVAIARGLMLKPKIMLLDEPTSALDIQTTTDFSNWIRELKNDTSFIIVTHDLAFAEQTAEKGLLMKEGMIQESGNIGTILNHINQN